MDKKKKTCIVVNSRANYGRIRSVLEAVRQHDKLELQLIIGASALLYRFGQVIDNIRADGFEPDALLYSIVEGENPVTMAKSTGIAITELSTIFQTLKPDVVLTVADRFETLATAVTSSYMNIPLAHTQGGETTGSIDESVRHAITKLAHLHFPSTGQSAKNIIRMGELRENVYNVGCPSIDAISNISLSIAADTLPQNQGVGEEIDFSNSYLVVLQHPVTTEYGQGLEQIRETLSAVKALGIQTVWLWPNVDAGSDEISKGIRIFREKSQDAPPIRLFRNLTIEAYARLVANCSCILGNSSSAIREGSFLGAPAVNIGSRQQGRECAGNVLHVDHNADSIVDAVQRQIEHGRYPSSKLYGDGTAGEKIAEILAVTTVDIQKKLAY